MKDNALIDKKAYQLAKDYLPSLGIAGVTASVIEKYLNPCTPKPTSKEEIYQRILKSAQNANMKANVVGKAIGGIQKLSVVLEGFNPRAVVDKYADDWEAILNDIEEKLKPRKKDRIRRTPRSIWPHYCQTILSAANFVEQFSSVSDFFMWVDFFYKDDRTCASLPLLLSREIEGFGFALSCDFLKEMGYVKFPKPDVQLRDIFTALSLCQDKPNDYQLFKAVIRVARNAGVSAYNADKVFWLIGSGNLYNDLHIGRQGNIGSKKEEFIEFAKPILENL